jgi:hypothetical protein
MGVKRTCFKIDRLPLRWTATPLVAAILYVVRNPVEAGICTRASQWPYSRYRATVGLAEPPPWLNVEALHELFGGAAEFARLVQEGHLPVSDTNGNR